jgi:3-deoxy-D-manno-octulosonic-acid transferase
VTQVQWAYDAVLPALRAGARLWAARRPKLRAGLEGRRGLQARLAVFGGAHAGRCVWLHSASVGEYEQARPLAALLGERRPDLAVLQTFFSPSGYEYARRLGEAPHIEYLPEDTHAAVTAAVAAVRPQALVFFKFDLWPNLVAAAARARVPILLFDATLQPRSWRSRWPARALYRDLYRRLDVVSAVSAADAARFRALVPEHPGLHADGDTRFDQVVRRRRAARRAGVAPALVSTPRPFTLVAGSTWPADEAALLPCWRDVVATGIPSRLILVPHEPTPDHLATAEAALSRLGLESVRYSQLGDACRAGIVVVDRVGILAELYETGDAAYVGGAFTTGVHSVLEPAIMGIPVLFGPRHDNSPEAGMLLDAGAARVVRSGVDFTAALRDLVSDAAGRRRMGEQARALVEANLGASERCFRHLERCLTAAAADRRESRL